MLFVTLSGNQKQLKMEKIKLEVGQQITLLTSGGNPSAIYTVARVTSTQAAISRNAMLHDGQYEAKFKREIFPEEIFHAIGDTGWNKDWYRLTKPGDAEIILAAKGRSTLRNMDWSKVSTENVAAILEILEVQIYIKSN